MSEIRIENGAVLSAFRAGQGPVFARVDQAMRQGATLLQREWRRQVHKAEGTLQRQIHVNKLRELAYEITSGARHARFAEEGTGLLGPRHASSGNRMLSDSGVAAIALWIKRKGVTPRSPGVSAEQLPWLISRRIAKLGTPPQPAVQGAIDRQLPTIHRLIDDAMALGLRDVGLQVN